MSGDDAAYGIWQRAQDLGHQIVGRESAPPGCRDQRIEEDRVPRHLRFAQLPYPPIRVAGQRPIEPVRAGDGMGGEVRHVRRREEARAVLHRVERIALPAEVDPGIDETVGMVDAQAVELSQHLLHAALEEAQRGALVLGGIENGVVPRLPRRIGAAGGRTHPDRGQEDGGEAPDVLVRDADLQIAVEAETERACLGAERLVLLVGEQLLELIAGDEGGMLARQLRSSRLRGGLAARRRMEQAPIAFGPAQPVALLVVGAKSGMERVPLEPVGVGARKLARALVQLVARGGERGAERAIHVPEYRGVSHACLGVLWPRAKRVLERRFRQDALVAQRTEREGKRIAGEERAVVGRGVDLPCGPSWSPSNPSSCAKRRKSRPPREKGAPRPASSEGSPGSAASCTPRSSRRIPSASSALRTSARVAVTSERARRRRGAVSSSPPRRADRPTPSVPRGPGRDFRRPILRTRKRRCS